MHPRDLCWGVVVLDMAGFHRHRGVEYPTTEHGLRAGRNVPISSDSFLSAMLAVLAVCVGGEGERRSIREQRGSSCW